MRVKDVMTCPAVCVAATTSLSEAISLMIQGKLSGLPVLDNAGLLIGILSEGDLMRRVELGSGTADASWWSHLLTSGSSAEAYRHSNGRQVADVMTANPIVIGEGDTLGDAARLMQKHRVKRLPVIREKRVVGIQSRADFVKALRDFVVPAYEEPAISDAEIKERICAEIAYQDWSANCSVHVEVSQGKVALTGLVPSVTHEASVRIALENTPGVQSVDSMLSIMEPVLVPGF